MIHPSSLVQRTGLYVLELAFKNLTEGTKREGCEEEAARVKGKGYAIEAIWSRLNQAKGKTGYSQSNSGVTLT